MKIKEVLVKTVLTRTAISGFDYCLNPYVGCGHGCRYCYASFMKRFTGHREPWGEFVDVKVNAVFRLKEQLKRARRGVVALGTVTDPYQPLERRYGVTRGCLEALLERGFPVHVLTRSPLCLRDVDLFKGFEHIEVGLSITTDDDQMRKIFEPRSPPISERLRALEVLRQNGVKTYAFIGPILPLKPEAVVKMLVGRVEEVWIDRMNYMQKVKRLYERNGLDTYLTDDYFKLVGVALKEGFEKRGIGVSVLF
ncbi:MAG: radical SAM protein [Desulfobacterota bacterium]|nr:radical SAM protein [Thermodesulfobacteriota bacterium]